MFKILHNPRCGKSRDTLKILLEKNIEVEEILYLQNPPSEKLLSELLQKLDLKAEDIVRKGETLYKENYKGNTISEKEWLKILNKNPILIERPIVFNDKKAAIGRPPENVLNILD
jgi:arsenate reductase